MKYTKIITLLLFSLLFSSYTYSQKMRQNTFFLGTNSLNFMSKVNSSLNSSSTITTNNQSSTTSIDYQINSDDEYKLNLNLTGGYFVIDNLLFGIDANINTMDMLKDYSNPSDTNFSYSLNSNETMITFGGFLRYYYHLGTGFIFASSGFNYGMANNNSTEVFISESSTVKTNINFGIGYSLKISSKFNLEPEFTYYIQDRTQETSSEGGLLNIQEETTITESTQGIQFKLGLSFYL